MSKRLSALLVSTLTLAACQSAIAPSEESADSSSSVTTEVNSSSSAGSEEAVDPQGKTNADAWAMVKAWTPGLTWSFPERGTNDTEMYIDDNHVIPAQALQAEFMTSTMTRAQFTKFFEDSRSTLEATAQTSNWLKHKWFDADGVTGTSFGFRLDTPQGVKFLIVSANGTDCKGASDQLPTCSTYASMALITDALPTDADL
ncbi:MAG: hypothetical protein Q7R81_05835 [Candidatus Peregrinibacteria bacterium]|nr:hypothetical protein [Candidatus Peregrinibacteria bacterium]